MKTELSIIGMILLATEFSKLQGHRESMKAAVNTRRCFTGNLTYINKACKIVTPSLSIPERFNTSCVASLHVPLSVKHEV